MLRGVVIVGILAVAAVAAAQPATFTLDVSPVEGGLDDSYIATVQIEVNGVAGAERYWHPDFGDFKVVDTRTSHSTSMVFDPTRGQELRTTEIRRYVLQPKRAGRLPIGPAKVRIAGEDYETRAVSVTVRATGSAADIPGAVPDPTSSGGIGVPGFKPPKLPRGRPPAMFLHPVIDKTRVTVGEQVIVTWLLYTRADVLGFEPRPPTLGNFWWEPLFEPRQRLKYHEDYVDRVPYLVTIISKRALFPTRHGQLEIPPFRAKVSTSMSALGSAEEIASPPLRLRVEPLPPGAPAGFDPTYVGVYSVDASVDRSQIDATESITLTVTVRGEGALRRTSPPVIAAPGFDVTGPREDDPRVDRSTDVVRGERIYRYWLVPQRGGDLTIPAIVIPYFDAGSDRYREARSSPIPITVVGDPDAVDDDGKGGGGLRENVIARDIRPSHDTDTLSAAIAPFLYRQLWFWLIAGMPLGVFVGVVVVDKLRERLRAETPRSRLRKARGRARRRFKVADIHLRGNRPAKLFAELSAAIYEHLEDRLGGSVQSMTREQMRQHLVNKGFPQTTVERIERELETFDFARFAPSASGPGEMRAAIRRTRELLAEIERVRPAGKDASEEAAA